MNMSFIIKVKFSVLIKWLYGSSQPPPPPLQLCSLWSLEWLTSIEQ